MNPPPHIVQIQIRLRLGTITKDEYETLVEWLGYPPGSRPQRNHRVLQGADDGRIKCSATSWPD